MKCTIPFLAFVLLIPTGVTNAMGQEVLDIGAVDENTNQTITIQIPTNNNQNTTINELKLEFKKDIRELLRDIDTKDFEAKSDELKSEYDEFFRVTIEQVRISSETRDLTDEEIAAAMDYIFFETIKDEKRKIREEKIRSSNIAYAEISSPKKQLESGVLLYDILCRTGKILIVRDDVRPACVSFTTAAELSKRGLLVAESTIVEPTTIPSESATITQLN